MNKNPNRAFSLIELLVVVAIVAVLAAVAIPAYRQYAIKTQISRMIMPVQEDLVKREMIYYGKNGVFGTAYNLGLNSVPSNNPSNPTNWGSFIAGISIDIGASVAGNAQCVSVDVVISGASIGYGVTLNNTGSGVNGNNNLGYHFDIFSQTNGAGSGNDAIKVICGTWNNQTSDYAYLPSNCGYRYWTSGPMGSFYSGSNGVCY